MTESNHKAVKSYSLPSNRSFFPEEEALGPNILQAHHLQMINEALCSLGEFGEVRLIVEKGRLRYLVTQKSLDVLKWQPGTPVKDLR